MYNVGLTGGIGSGKTLVGNIFSTFGIPVFCADEKAKELYDTNEIVRTELIKLLGSDIYIENKLQRKRMAQKIFSNPELLQKVNNLVHPILCEQFLQFSAQQQSPYVLLEAAILFESKLDKQMQKIITVTASETTRLKRVAQRDKTSEEAIRERMRHQWTDEQRAAVADFIITNDEQQALLPQIIKIHEQLLADAI